MKNEFFTSIFVMLGLCSLGKPNCLDTLRHGLEALLTCLQTFWSHLAFNLGMTLTLKVNVKVTMPTRGLTVTTIIISLWLIVIEFQA